MDHLSETQVEQLKSRLEEQRAELVSALTPGALTETSAQAEPSDMQDKARQEKDRVRSIALGEGMRDRVHEIDAALQRMEEGTYGLCEETGEEIPFARLEAEPTARYTVEAQEAVERSAATRNPDEGGY